MRVQVYSQYSGTVTVTVATQRTEAAASNKFQFASIHQDYAAKVRALMKEHRHVGASSLAYPIAKRLQTYFPVFPLVTGNPLYAVRELKPAGSPQDQEQEWQLEIMRIRYDLTINLLPAAFFADEIITEGIERNMQLAWKQLFDANGIPSIFIPGDQAQRPGFGTDVDIICELGPATARTGMDLPAPA